MKSLTNISAGLCIALTAALPASATLVTFQVNMSAQIALGNFNPTTDTVNLAGDPINGWSTSASPLTTADTNIWTGTFDVTGSAGATVQYKYVINTPSGPPTWEGTVGPGGGNGNRTFALGSSAQTLPVVYFNNASNSLSVTNVITFQVDMSVQTSLGNFDPSSGLVNLAGPFNSWSTSATPMTNSTTDTNIWFTTLTLSGALGSSIDYKYIMNGGTWEGNVGPGGAQNRSVTLQRTNQTLSGVYFNNQAAPPVPIPLVFEVNLAVQIEQGNFDPTTGLVEARGSFNNNWAGGFTLTNSPDNTNIYSGTFVDTTDVQGTSIGYKFVLNGSTWESINNRTYMLTSTNQQTLPLVFFNDVGDLGPISILTSSPGQAALSWTAGPLVRLQNATSLVNPTWQDVPNTQGTNAITVPIGPSPLFFRLTGP